nr:uncharacterized protein LOC129163630 [Nothobranchius furzeri]
MRLKRADDSLSLFLFYITAVVVSVDLEQSDLSRGKSLDSLREAAGSKRLPHSSSWLSGDLNTTHHEDIPPRIGTTERLTLSKPNGGGTKKKGVSAGGWLWCSKNDCTQMDLSEDGRRLCLDKRGKGEEGWPAVGAARLSSYQRSCFLQEQQQQQRERGELRVATPKSATEQREPNTRERKRGNSRVFPCQGWEPGQVQEQQGSRGGRDGCLPSTIMPRLQRAKLGKQPRCLTDAQSSPVNSTHPAHPPACPSSL